MIQRETFNVCLTGNAPLPVRSDRVTVAPFGSHERVARVREETRAIIEALSTSFAGGEDALERVYRERVQPHLAVIQAEIDGLEAEMSAVRALVSGLRAARVSAPGEVRPTPDNRTAQAAAVVGSGFSLGALGGALLEMTGKDAVVLALREADGRPVTAAGVSDRLEGLGHETSRQNVRTQLSRAGSPPDGGTPLAVSTDGAWVITDHGREVADRLLESRGLPAAG